MAVRQIDIAKKLGVTRITVSKALRDHPDISEAMKTKVRKTAEEMGYIPNRLASQLQTKKSYTIGVVVPGIANSFFSLVTHGIIDYATPKGYHIILTVSLENPDMELENLRTLMSMRVDGILISVSQNTIDTGIFELIKQYEIPLIFFDRDIPGLDCFSRVGIDNVKAAKELLDFVLDKGYTRVAHLAGTQVSTIGRDRYEGYLQSMKAHGIEPDPKLFVEGGFDVKSGYNGFMRLLEQGGMPEVVYAANDQIAQGVYHACEDKGIKIPDDLGVVAFGHDDFANIMSPKLTIIDNPPELLGKTAIEQLIDEMKGTPNTNPSTVLVDTHLVVNRSIL